MLKKTAPAALVGILALLVGGCSAEESPAPDPEMSVEDAQTEEGAVNAEVSEDSVSVEVDESFLTVDITLPAEIYEGVSEEEIAQSVEAEYSDFVVNPDGSVTFTMAKGVWEQYLREMKTDLDAAIQEMVNEAPEVVKSVSYDNDVSEFEVVVDRAAYESNMEAQWLGFGLNLQAQFYQLFAGVPENERGGETRFVDEATGEVFETQAWPVDD